MTARPTEQGWDLQSREKMAIGSDSTDGWELIKLPNKLSPIFKKPNSGGQVRPQWWTKTRIVDDLILIIGIPRGRVFDFQFVRPAANIE
jgi:hypothetical protein